MSVDIESEAQANAGKDKGKGRAPDVTECTPLLTSGSSGSARTEQSAPLARRRPRLGSGLICVFFTFLLISICAVAMLFFLAWSYSSQASEMSPEDIIHKALVLEGPDRIDVLNVSMSDGIWVNVEGRIGLDAGAVVGVNSNPGDSFLGKIWKALGRWGVQKLDTVTIRTSTITIASHLHPSVLLAQIDVPPLEIPLTVDPPADSNWLQRISTPVLVRPTSQTSDLLHFAQESWKSGQVMVKTEVPMVDVRGGGLSGTSWRNRLHRQLSDVVTALSVKVPRLPGFPHPGQIPSLTKLVTLRSFQLANKADNLTIQAVATIADPVPPTFSVTTPTLPFTVSLLPQNSPIPIASVRTHSFDLTHPNITLDISGYVLPLPPHAFPILSTFLSRYLSGRSNPISISTPLLPELTVEVPFPAPHPRPRILRNVTIHDMKIKPGNTFLASGTVLAHAVLPKGMNVDLDVQYVLPDVLVFDGEVPDDVHSDTPPKSPLPDPLPEKAFGRIRPDDWLASRCVSIEPAEDGGATFAVSAKIVDVPLEVLPGRESVFSSFVSKIIFGNGAVAGILGTAAVKVYVPGIPSEGPGTSDGMELDGLPFRGSVKLGKGNLFRSVLTGTKEKWENVWKDALRKIVPVHRHR